MLRGINGLITLPIQRQSSLGEGKTHKSHSQLPSKVTYSIGISGGSEGGEGVKNLLPVRIASKIVGSSLR
jgi:hypothetical protein